jgi:CheY-like chemotaxis protein
MTPKAVKICFMVDDDIDDQEIFSIALDEIDQKVDCVFASDGIEALQKLHEDPLFEPDYIFLDLNMPKMNGKQCLEEIKKISRLSQTPIIIYSTSSEKKSITEVKLIGATAYFTKPSSISELAKKLAEFLK